MTEPLAESPAVDPLSVLEAALLCAKVPMREETMLALYADGSVDAQQLRGWLEQLTIDWMHRGLELVQVSSGWRFQSRTKVMPYLSRLEPERTPKYSRAAMEILAVIAYRQPVTRGDIEEIRGVAVNSQIVKQLEERGWIEVIGHRETVGRPALFATTGQFLDDLGLSSLQELPEIEAVSEATLKQLNLQSAPQAVAPLSATSPVIDGEDDAGQATIHAATTSPADVVPHATLEVDATKLEQGDDTLHVLENDIVMVDVVAGMSMPVAVEVDDQGESEGELSVVASADTPLDTSQEAEVEPFDDDVDALLDERITNNANEGSAPQRDD